MIKNILKIILIVPIICSSIFAFGEEDEISMITTMDKFIKESSKRGQKEQLKIGERVYLDSLENGQYISVYKDPGITWKRCNREEKKQNTKFSNCVAIGWPDRNSFVFTLKDQFNQAIIKTQIEEEELEFVYDAATDRKYVVPRNREIKYSKIYFRYFRKVIEGGRETIKEQQGIGWIPFEYLSSETHKPFYRAVTPAATPTPVPAPKRFPDPAPTSNKLNNLPIGEPKTKPPVPENKKPTVLPAQPPVREKPSKIEPIPSIIEQQSPTQEQLSTPEIPSTTEVVPTQPSSKTENHLDAVEYIVNLLKTRLGVCIIPNFKELSTPPYKNNYNPFDRLVLPKLNALNINFIDQINQIGSSLFLRKKVSLEDIVAIDALARTMYAEMGICYKNGLHYPMAVAKIALNRTRAEGKLFSSYTNEVPHDSDKSDLTKILTTPSQFNAWIPKKSVIVERRELQTSAFKQVLCPPISGDKAFYTGSKPNINEQNVWLNSLRIATEAVLFSEEFKERTDEIQGDHYSSGLKQKKWHGMTKVYPSIEGRKFSNEPRSEACMQIWMK